MKLHLGCGQVHLDGYVNIDYPPEEHTLMSRTRADVETDLLGLRYAPGEIDEVRLHHVFEHFRRPTAYALVASWASWLRPGGVLRIEVPDFDRTSRHVLSPLTSRRRKRVGLRHIFGSNEARWAVHYEGWSGRRLKEVLEDFGFTRPRVKRNRWKGTYNVDVTATNGPRRLSRREVDAAARSRLHDFLVDDSELPLLEVWMAEYGQQMDRSWAE